MDEEEKGELVVMMDVQRQQEQQSGPTASVGGLNRPTPALDPDFYGNGGNIPSFSSFGQNGASVGATNTGGGGGGTGGGPLASSYLGPGALPFLNSSSSDQNQNQAYHYFGSSSTGGPSADMSSSSSSSLPSSTSSSPFPPMMTFPDFSSIPMSLSSPGIGSGQSFFFPANSSSGSNNSSNPRNAQSVLPYEILQGVQSNSNGRSPGFDLDWVKLAGMETWYSGVAAAFDGSL